MSHSPSPVPATNDWLDGVVRDMFRDFRRSILTGEFSCLSPYRSRFRARGLLLRRQRRCALQRLRRARA